MKEIKNKKYMKKLGLLVILGFLSLAGNAFAVPVPSIELGSSSGTFGDVVSISGAHFNESTTINVTINGHAGNIETSPITTNGGGAFNGTITIPTDATVESNTVTATDGVNTATAPFRVNEPVRVTTIHATAVTSTDATLNGVSGASAGIGHSFWASTSSFSTGSPVVPAGVYTTPDLGPIAADTNFSASLSSVSGLPAITPDTKYYFAAWINVGGTWYPGEILNFRTDPIEDETETVKVTIVKYIDGEMATAESADNTSFPMASSWDAENIGAGSGSYVLAADNSTAYTAVTSDMTSGADYSTNEVTDTEAVGTSCEAQGTNYALLGYTTGDTLNDAEEATPSMTTPAFTNLTSDKYVIVWNDDCDTEEPDEGVGGDIGGEVVAGNGILEVTSIETIDPTATANGNFEDGWEYVFNITIPTDEPDLAMKFADWVRTGGGGTIPAANNIRISSDQADNGGATILITAANTYSTPALHMISDLNSSLDGLQVRVTVEVRVPAGTPTGLYTTSYGVLTS